MILSNDTIAVEIAPIGAELMSLTDRDAREWLWQGDVSSWSRRSPILFPVIGRCAANVLRHRGREYPAPTAHGFGPTQTFDVVSHDTSSCLLRLESDAETRRSYPFEFRLDVTFALEAGGVRQTASVTNPGSEIMPVSVGFHPGFQWPSPPHFTAARAKEAYVALFERDEPAPVRRLAHGLLSATAIPSSVDGRCLALSESLFQEGALIFDRLESRSVWFGVPGERGLRVDFPDMPHLGLWMLPGAKFLCIEPWQGHACPENFQGDVLHKPGMVHLAPGESFSRSMMISIGVPA